MKKLSLVLVVLFALMSVTVVNAEQPATVMFDGSVLKFPVNPILENGTTLVPLKTMLEAFGAKITWNTSNSSATVTKGGASLWLQLDNTTVKINNVEKKLAAASKTSNGYTMVPVGAITEAFGATQIWDENSRIVHIFTKKEVQKQYYENGKPQYEGELVNGIYNGKGTYYWENGDKYTGDFLNGQFHGYGTIVWADGTRYEGQWKYDDRTGQGTISWPNGDKYTGQWLNNQMNGKGKMTWGASGNTYEGLWVNGEISDGSTAQASQNSEIEQFKKQALDGPSYQELNKGSARHLDKPAYFNGKVIQAIEAADGNTLILVDTSYSANSFIDMYNTYGNNTYYLDSVSTKIVAVFSDKPVDILEEDTVDIYGTITDSYTYSTQAGYTMTVPAMNLYTFERTNYRSDEIFNMMFGN